MYSISIIVPLGRITKREKLGINSIITSCDYNKKVELIIILNNGLTKKEVESNFQKNILKVLGSPNINSINKAREIGMINSKGKYLLFHDADDILLPNSINIFLNDVKMNYDLYSYSIIRYKYLKAKGQNNLNKIHDFQITCKCKNEIAKNYWSYPTNVVNKLIKRTCIDYDFDDLSFSQDLNISYKLLANIDNWKHSKKATYFYLCDDEYGISGRNLIDKEIKETIVNNYKMIKKHWKNNNYELINNKLRLRFELLLIRKMKYGFFHKLKILLIYIDKISDFKTFIKIMSIIK